MAYPFKKGSIVSEQPRNGDLGAHVSTFMSVVSGVFHLDNSNPTEAFERPFEVDRKEPCRCLQY